MVVSVAMIVIGLSVAVLLKLMGPLGLFFTICLTVIGGAVFTWNYNDDE